MDILLNVRRVLLAALATIPLFCLMLYVGRLADIASLTGDQGANYLIVTAGLLYFLVSISIAIALKNSVDCAVWLWRRCHGS